jgi:hypothetical protein
MGYNNTWESLGTLLGMIIGKNYMDKSEAKDLRTQATTERDFYRKLAGNGQQPTTQVQFKTPTDFQLQQPQGSPIDNAGLITQKANNPFADLSNTPQKDLYKTLGENVNITSLPPSVPNLSSISSGKQADYYDSILTLKNPRAMKKMLENPNMQKMIDLQSQEEYKRQGSKYIDYAMTTGQKELDGIKDEKQRMTKAFQIANNIKSIDPSFDNKMFISLQKNADLETRSYYDNDGNHIVEYFQKSDPSNVVYSKNVGQDMNALQKATIENTNKATALLGTGRGGSGVGAGGATVEQIWGSKALTNPEQRQKAKEIGMGLLEEAGGLPAGSQARYNKVQEAGGYMAMAGVPLGAFQNDATYLMVNQVQPQGIPSPTDYTPQNNTPARVLPTNTYDEYGSSSGNWDEGSYQGDVNMPQGGFLGSLFDNELAQKMKNNPNW